ncbi:MAG: exodeoxyribonuclease V subunit gamma [Rhodococcus sp.]|nr:exodeoxyribonuclease V subunit gamma [Rhodococcus sp. (in: high G+C Gram-positive bacteria)]
MLRVHRAEQTDTLAGALALLLAQPLDDPFAVEVIAVPAKGVERWLTQQLATTLGADGNVDGVAANIEFPSPARLVAEVSAAVGGMSADDDPWSAGRLVWTVLEIIDGAVAANKEWAAPLVRHLGGGTDEYRSRRRYATAQHAVNLLNRYMSQRPAMMRAWAEGRIEDGTGEALTDDQWWQVELFRRVRDAVQTPSPAERLPALCKRLREQPDLVTLPARISLFGPTRLNVDQLEVLDALAVHRDVHVWLSHPSPTMWDELSSKTPPLVRSHDNSALELSNPLLINLSRDVREMQFRLSAFTATPEYHRGERGSSSLLATLQDDVVADRGPCPAAFDGTVTVHACHGPMRQVEVLREELLHAFVQDPTLEPRDVIVMCPNVETYAPLVRAVFGSTGDPGNEHPGHQLRVRLADRGLRRTNPVLDVIATVLSLAEGRVKASEVLDLIDHAPVRARFRFTDDDVERMRGWTKASGARWGISPRQRSQFGLADFEHNTFRRGLDRILLGASCTEDGWLGDTLPLGDVESGDLDVAGRFSEFIDRLDVVLRDLAGPHSVSQWAQHLGRALDLLTDTAHRDEWQQAQARRELGEALAHGDDRVLQLADVRALLSSLLAGRPSRANFRTGELTVCAMVPMRSVPHRVVVMLGLDDDVFPRGSGIDGDDICGITPLVGERDPRSEDRQLLLDAMMAAGQKLMLFYTGADPIKGDERPPAIPLSGVIDVLKQMTGGEEFLTRHPLQPFDPANFDAVSPRSFDRSALAGARAKAGPTKKRVSLADLTFRQLPPTDVDLEDLVNFAVDPAAAFLKQRLGIRVPKLEETPSDSIPIELGGLDEWAIGNRMLTAMLEGRAIADIKQAEWLRGELPPANFRDQALRRIGANVQGLVAECEPLYVGDPHTEYVSVDIGGGRRVTGTVSNIYNGALVQSSYSTLAAKHRMEAWVRLLAVAAHTGGATRNAVTIGRNKKWAVRCSLVAPEDAHSVLRRLVELRDRGLKELLPAAPKTLETYARSRRENDDAKSSVEKAAKNWASEYGEARDDVRRYLYGVDAPIEVLTATPGVSEPTLFGDVAVALWSPLLDAEVES